MKTTMTAIATICFASVTMTVTMAANAQTAGDTRTAPAGLSAGSVQLVVPMPPAAANAHENSADTQHFCYYAGKPYSPGSKLEGQVCADPAGGKRSANVLSSTPPPLRWVPAAQYMRGDY